MPEPTRRRVTAVMADVVGSSKEKDRIGIARGNAVIKARLDEVAVALMAADPTATISPGEGGDSITIFGSPAAAAAIFKAAVEHQEVFWSLPVRIVIGAGDLIEDDQHRARFLDRIGKLKSVCEPGEVVVTEAIFEAVADDGRGHLLTSASTTLPGLGETRYWVASGERMAPRDDEPRASDIDRRMLAMEQITSNCARDTAANERNISANAVNAAANAVHIAEVKKIVERMRWTFVFILLGSLTLGLVFAVGLLVSGALRSALSGGVVAPALAGSPESLAGGGTPR